MDPLIQTILYGVGLLACGYILGLGRGAILGSSNTLKALYESKLADPEKVIAYFEKVKNKGQ